MPVTTPTMPDTIGIKLFDNTSHMNLKLFSFLLFKSETFEEMSRINIKTINVIIMINLTQEEIENALDFLPVVEYEGLYEVGKDGSVWSLNYNHTGRRKQLVPTPYDKLGHLKVNLCKDGKQKTQHVHQLVLNAYLPKPSSELVVMHKDSKPANNRLENLAWGSHLENNNDPHCKALLTNHPAKSTPVLCVETGEQYPSVREAERQTGVDSGNISKSLNGTRKTAGGYHWQKVAEKQ